MSSVNRVFLLGRVGQKPETKEFNSTQVVNFSVATSKKIKDVVHTEWHRIEAWDKLVEIVSSYVNKGDQVCVEGEIKTDKYTDKDGNEKSVVKIRATNITLLGSKNDSNNESNTKDEVVDKRKEPAKSIVDDSDDSELNNLPF